MNGMTFALELATIVSGTSGALSTFACDAGQVTKIGDVAVPSHDGEVVAQIYMSENGNFAVVELALDLASDVQASKCNVSTVSTMREALVQFEDILNRAKHAQQANLMRNTFAMTHSSGNRQAAFLH